MHAYQFKCAFVKEILKPKIFQKVSKSFFEIVRARGKRQPRDLCVWIGHENSELFRFQLIFERRPKLREMKKEKGLPRISTFRIFPL